MWTVSSPTAAPAWPGAVIAVTLALMANLVFKIGLVISIGGGKLARHALPGLLGIGVGMAAGLMLI